MSLHQEAGTETRLRCQEPGPGFRGLGEALRSRRRTLSPQAAGFVRTRPRTRAESGNQKEAEGKGRGLTRVSRMRALHKQFGGLFLAALLCSGR